MSLSRIPRLSAGEAAAMLSDGDTVGFGGFTAAATPKALPAALAARTRAERAAGRDFRIGAITVSTGQAFDGVLAESETVAFKTPYQSSPLFRALVNSGSVRFFDMHLSHVTQALRYGFLGPLHWAVLEVADLADSGEAILTSAVGAAPTLVARAPNILVEINRRHPATLRGLHDLYEAADPPHRREIPIYRASDRIGEPVLRIDPAKIRGVIETDASDEGAAFSEPDAATAAIGRNVAEFLAREIAEERIPKTFLPLQSGVGDIANCVLAALGEHPDVPRFEMYTEIVQDAVIRLMEAGRVRFASCCALAVSPAALARVYGNLDWFKQRLVLRSQEITNHPEVVRRLGLISMNTALEADLFGNVNSTHVFGRQMMNGIGGSGDFTRNAYLSIFTCPSTAKAGRISTIVPMVSHQDHSEHSVQVLATEWGVADLRGRTPRERARLIVENCAHPDYREALASYLRLAAGCHTPATLRAAFAFHQRYEETGDMRGVRFDGAEGVKA
ncbi:MAG TPA: succinate CoA transferase [Bryobacteraceae bacterium]